MVIPALLVFGPLSDAKGRRELLTGAILLAAVAAALFAAAQALWVLFVAQAVQAMALGALQGTGAPTLVEHDPSDHKRRASAIASATTVGGAAAGPLLAAARGIGMGLAFMGSLGDVSEIAPEHRKGDIVASYYVVVYIATAIPAVGVGALSVAIDPSTAIQVFGYAVIALCLAGLGGLLLELGGRQRFGGSASPTSRLRA